MIRTGNLAIKDLLLAKPYLIPEDSYFEYLAGIDKEMAVEVAVNGGARPAVLTPPSSIRPRFRASEPGTADTRIFGQRRAGPSLATARPSN